jgi:hypothetical protein
VGLPAQVKTILQNKKNAHEADRVAAVAAGVSTVAAAAARAKLDAERAAMAAGDSLA